MLWGGGGVPEPVSMRLTVECVVKMSSAALMKAPPNDGAEKQKTDNHQIFDVFVVQEGTHELS